MAVATYEKVQHIIPAVEWATFEPDIEAIDALKREHDAVILAHNYMTPEVFHGVAEGRATGGLQLGQPAWIVEATGLPVVSDLRSTDIAAGGHGAPLASTLDALWLASADTRVALNLGGIANVTVVPPTPREGSPRTDRAVGSSPRGPASVVAFDTGPANGLMDAWCLRHTGQPFDRGGALAAGGRVDAALLARYQAWRGLDTLMTAAATDTLTRLFGLPGRTASAIRRFGISAVDRIVPLKVRFMAEALGESGATPRLLQGLSV